MTDCFSFDRGDTPLLISVPHDGRELAPGMAGRMSDVGLSLPDTDWHVRQLYNFASSLGAGTIAANYSRYVVDLNRPSSDEKLYAGQLSTGLFPTRTFAGESIYRDANEIDGDELQHRLASYWQPYHSKIENELTEIRDRFGYALLWDAHSIRTKVPDLFDGELPELSIGTSNGNSCDTSLEMAVAAVAKKSGYSSVSNGRFQGGHITRHFGSPPRNIHAVQLELTQHCYMDEESGEYDQQKSAKLVNTLKSMLAALLETAVRKYR
jgi:N-formylglutamate amidohydrolase